MINLGNLQIFDIENNQIEHIPPCIKHLPNLQRFFISGNKIPLSDLQSLNIIHLKMNDCGLTSLNNQDNVYLQELLMTENQIMKIENDVFQNMPNLASLHLDNN